VPETAKNDRGGSLQSFYNHDQLMISQNCFDKNKKGRDLIVKSIYTVSFLSNQMKKSNTFNRKALRQISKICHRFSEGVFFMLI